MDARWCALIVLTAARASMAYQFQSVGSVAPGLIPDLGIGYTGLGFLIGLYILPGIGLAFPGGMLGRWFGDNRVVLAGLLRMAAGGAVMSSARTYPAFAAGRVNSGIGGVLLNVIMSKLIVDWFAGREIVPAIAVFVNSFPIGIGLAQVTIAPAAAGAGWQTARGLPVIAPLIALVLLILPLYAAFRLLQRQHGQPAGKLSQPAGQRFMPR